ncbi:MAG: hypothetical protein ACOCWS_04595 [Alkalispirochaetaceae bacterium]
MKKLLLLGVAALFMASCATVPVAQREPRIERLLETLNEGSVEDVLPATGSPFLLDREIIILDRDIETMWTNLREVGFTFADYRIRSVEEVTAESFRRLGESMDVEVYFQKYLPEGAAVVTVETDNGTFLLLTGGRVDGAPQLFGMRGPV